MIEYSWDFLSVFEYYVVFIRGFIGTLKLTFFTMLLGMSGGLIIGAARLSKHLLLKFPAAAFVEFFRNIPAMIILIWIFYALPIILGFRLDTFSAAVIAMSLNTAAFSSEVFRAGIQSVEKGQWDAGRALGMNYFTLMRRIILPQAIKIMVPALTNRGIGVVKITSLASTIAYGELLYEGKLLSGIIFRPLEVYTTLAVIYFVVLYTGTYFTYILEKRLSKRD